MTSDLEYRKVNGFYEYDVWTVSDFNGLRLSPKLFERIMYCVLMSPFENLDVKVKAIKGDPIVDFKRIILTGSNHDGVLYAGYTSPDHKDVLCSLFKYMFRPYLRTCIHLNITDKNSTDKWSAVGFEYTIPHGDIFETRLSWCIIKLHKIKTVDPPHLHSKTVIAFPRLLIPETTLGELISGKNRNVRDCKSETIFIKDYTRNLEYLEYPWIFKSAGLLGLKYFELYNVKYSLVGDFKTQITDDVLELSGYSGSHEEIASLRYSFLEDVIHKYSLPDDDYKKLAPYQLELIVASFPSTEFKNFTQYVNGDLIGYRPPSHEFIIVILEYRCVNNYTVLVGGPLVSGSAGEHRLLIKKSPVKYIDKTKNIKYHQEQCKRTPAKTIMRTLNI